MKQININIDNAKILSYNVELKKDLPEVSATIGLFAGKKQISTFSLSSGYEYNNTVKFELPYELIQPIKDIANQLETILIQNANSQLGRIEAPK